MASDTDTARADPEPSTTATAGRRFGLGRFRLSALRSGGFRPGGSRLGGFILALNLLSLLILFGGALALNEWRRGLVEARQQSLTVQAELLANLLGEAGATRGEPRPMLNPTDAALLLRDKFIPTGQRARLYDQDGLLVTDSFAVSEIIGGSPLTAPLPAGVPARDPTAAQQDRNERLEDQAAEQLAAEVERALSGEAQATVRPSETGDPVVSVSIPVRHVQQVLGVLTLEAGDVDEILSAQRRALVPFALVALAVNLLASLVLHLFVARPIMRLSRAADEVRMQRARAISLPDLEGRKDEIGDLARSLETMTETLSARMDAIEGFAADVSHEIKNPLTSIRSALETLALVKTDAQKDKLTTLLQQDVRRLDRLITDISNASRLDAELSRERPRLIDMGELLNEVVQIYAATSKPGEAAVGLEVRPAAGAEARVLGQDGPLGQVFRNLIDNARSFSPPGGTVRVTLERDPIDACPIHVRVEDDGPGIPPDNLNTVFERFYTSRPKGTAFGSNSGLGLSIVRQIVEAHGGRVWAENRTDAEGAVTGARFTVALPAGSTGRRA
ncbi:MAG TPA: stimulus-sensing domain-containing protein [Brevundimonas sp.]|uniref:stimulus-sensing domain-containing protein n=1 Tax=Brevundimonas sp. TaxID=1871086 RepID=UPI002C029520|nr:stimulus-sensing domain-containing protein [Brevundimonas sp.]HRO32406.1 stimulus-sensing domain-containing protein [Brevundimonas sp.]